MYYFFKKSTVIFVVAALLVTGGFNLKASGKPSAINQEDMIYFLLTDRFYDGDESNNIGIRKGDLTGYNGGDFQGIIEKLDYIKDLGFTAIWISPVVENQAGGYHGYWATDFYKTNEKFGSMNKLKELVSTAHQKGMKVIVDIVHNHTSRMHPWRSDPEFEDWFNEYRDINDYGNQEDVERGWLARLPDLNHDNPEVRKYLIEMSKWWIRETGIDGYRLDTTRHVPKHFWIEFSEEIKKEFPNFYLIGEVFHGDVDYVGAYQKTGLDGLFDFPIHFAINDVFKDDKSATVLADVINKTKSYDNRYLMGTFIDNHDVPRFVHQLHRLSEERLKSALTFMMTYTGIPVMYYGTEIAMEGAFDPDNRRFMDWEAQSHITDYVKKLTSLRKENKALTHGDVQVLQADEKFIAFTRKYEDSIMIIAFNTSEQQNKVQLTLSSEGNNKNSLVDLISSKAVKIKNNSAILDMAPMEASIYVYRNSPLSFVTIILYAATSLVLTGLIYFIIRRRKTH
jgi:glycosidase